MKSILIVDDDPNILNLYLLLMKKRFSDISVCAASNGREALEKICKKEYSLVLSDVEMPLMNGIELHKSLKADFPSLAPKTVFITGNSCPSHLSYFEEESLTYLLKPFKVRDLVTMIEGIIASASMGDGENTSHKGGSKRKHKRFSFRAEAKLSLSRTNSDGPINGEIINFSEGGMAFLSKKGLFPEKAKVTISVNALRLERREAQIVWAMKDNDHVRAGIKWL